jgi:RND family efflux transporter MFP subunit
VAEDGPRRVLSKTMSDTPVSTAPHGIRRRRRLLVSAGVSALVAIAVIWWWNGAKSQDANAAKKGPAPVPVVTARAEQRDVPVTLRANGTVVPIQTVDIRPQVTSVVRDVHIREGQSVKAGEHLFTLDARADEANYKKALAQIEKDKADLSTAQRNFDRQKELFNQKFISQSALDTVQNSVDTLRGQLAVDTAAADAARVAVGYSEIRATFPGRTGTIAVRAGSLVQPTSAPLVTITQVNPIQVSFTLPERELAGLRSAMAASAIDVNALIEGAGRVKGRLVFLDNTVDSATGTIRVKAEFENEKAQLWPGMYVNVEVAPRTLTQATVVPVQAVQTGPDNRFIYVVGADGKVVQRTVKVPLIDGAIAVVEGVQPGDRVVTEGAQNLRPGSAIAEAQRAGEAPAKGEGGKKGKKAEGAEKGA